MVVAASSRRRSPCAATPTPRCPASSGDASKLEGTETFVRSSIGSRDGRIFARSQPPRTNPNCQLPLSTCTRRSGKCGYAGGSLGQTDDAAAGVDAAVPPHSCSEVRAGGSWTQLMPLITGVESCRLPSMLRRYTDISQQMAAAATSHGGHLPLMMVGCVHLPSVCKLLAAVSHQSRQIREAASKVMPGPVCPVMVPGSAAEQSSPNYQTRQLTCAQTQQAQCETLQPTMSTSIFCHFFFRLVGVHGDWRDVGREGVPKARLLEHRDPV